MSTHDSTTTPASPGSFEEIRQILREAAIRSERNEVRAEAREKEAEARAREYEARAEAREKEAEARAREYEAREKARAKEADRRVEEIHEMIRKDREAAEWRFRHEAGRFDDRWGRFLESLVAGDLVPLLRAREIDVDTMSTRTQKQRDGRHMEIDILAVNGEEAVVVEVKTKLRPEAVNRFTEKLRVFRDWFPDHRGRTIYGAVAYLEGSDDVARHAERQGLFVIRATGSSASIVNAPDFEPREFP